MFERFVLSFAVFAPLKQELIHKEYTTILRSGHHKLHIYSTNVTNTGQRTIIIPCSTLLLLAGTWGSCLTLRADEFAAVDDENAGLECGCTLMERKERKNTKESMDTLD